MSMERQPADFIVQRRPKTMQLVLRLENITSHNVKQAPTIQQVSKYFSRKKSFDAYSCRRHNTLRKKQYRNMPLYLVHRRNITTIQDFINVVVFLWRKDVGTLSSATLSETFLLVIS